MTGTNSELAVISGGRALLDKEWDTIVDELVGSLAGNDLPGDVILATEYLLCGWPTYKISKQIKVSPAVIRSWLEKYPVMAMTVKNGSVLLQKWRLARLEQQFLLAVNKSEEILLLSLDGTEADQKTVATVAQHARYILGLYAGQKIDVSINTGEKDHTLKAREDALDYLAGKLSEYRDANEPIEATYTVVPANREEKTPLLKPDGEPFYGVMGELDSDESGFLCHICGNRYMGIAQHIQNAHKLPLKDYELVFMLPGGTIKHM